MKFKEIKSGMAIHCKNDEEKELLLEEAERLGYMWPTGNKPTKLSFPSNTIVFREDDIYWTGDSENHTEFSDLIIPESELSAEDALLAYDQMCRENYCCNDCPIYGIVGDECTHKMDGHISEIMDAIKKWKAEHEKKEPEIETVDICRIIEILPDGRKRCVHEEDIKSELPFGGDERQKVEEILKRYCMEHDGNFIAVHEVVSRVKAVE